MTEPRQALYAYLSAHSSVQAAVGDRIYQRRVPAGATKPLILVQPPIDRVPVRDLDGVAYRRSRIQVTAMAGAQPEAEKAAQAIMAAVEGYRGKMAGVLDVMQVMVDNDRQVDYADINEIHHHVDLILKHKG
jgi:hypothetical protein